MCRRTTTPPTSQPTSHIGSFSRLPFSTNLVNKTVVVLRQPNSSLSLQRNAIHSIYYSRPAACCPSPPPSFPVPSAPSSIPPPPSLLPFPSFPLLSSARPFVRASSISFHASNLCSSSLIFPNFLLHFQQQQQQKMGLVQSVKNNNKRSKTNKKAHQQQQQWHTTNNNGTTATTGNGNGAPQRRQQTEEDEQQPTAMR